MITLFLVITRRTNDENQVIKIMSLKSNQSFTPCKSPCLGLARDCKTLPLQNYMHETQQNENLKNVVIFLLPRMPKSLQPMFFLWWDQQM